MTAGTLDFPRNVAEMDHLWTPCLGFGAGDASKSPGYVSIDLQNRARTFLAARGKSRVTGRSASSRRLREISQGAGRAVLGVTFTSDTASHAHPAIQRALATIEEEELSEGDLDSEPSHLRFGTAATNRRHEKWHQVMRDVVQPDLYTTIVATAWKAQPADNLGIF